MKLLLINLSALCIAILLSFVVVRSIQNSKGSQKFQPKLKSGLYATYADNPVGEIDVARAIRDNNTILLFGSSELSSDDTVRTMPHHFIPDHTRYDLLSIGHAGNQCFSIFSQLLAYHNDLKNSKIVILVSPGWFTNNYEKGTSVHSFFEYVNERSLLHIYQNNQIDDKYMNYLSNYVVDNFEEINEPSYILKNIYFNSSTYNKVRYAHANALNNFLLRFRDKAFVLPEGNNTYTDSEISYEIKNKNPQWDSLFSVAKENHIKNSTNNSWGVNNDYYSQYVKGKTFDQKVSTQNKELADFKMLCDYLKSQQANALFVIQPLNPYAYTGLQEVEKVMNELSSVLQEDNLDYINLFTSSTDQYEIGILSDIMHLGDYGWLKIDKKIMEKYGK